MHHEEIEREVLLPLQSIKQKQTEFDPLLQREEVVLVVVGLVGRLVQIVSQRGNR